MKITEEILHSVHKIADHYGKVSQMSMLQEECAELIQSLSKLSRAGELEEEAVLKRKLSHMEARYSVAEEMADVWILLLQMEHLLENSDLVQLYMHQKIGRTLGKMESEATDVSGC